jgi:uncharacterized protein YceK
MRETGQRRRWCDTVAVATVMTVIVVVSGCENILSDQNGADVDGTDAETYTVSYDANGATSGTTPEPQPKTPGVDLTLATNSGNLQRTGDSFLGWNSAADGSGTDFDEGATYTTDADMTLYPRWSPLYQVGDTGPAEGIVFFDKGEYTDGWRYLEAWTANEAGNHRWKTTSTGTPGTWPTAIGSGYSNTYSGMTGTQHPAAEVVRNATHGGYSDWFLPSRDELNKMYENLYLEGLGGLSAGLYWSSSQCSTEGAWIRNFSDGVWSNMNKWQEYPVRAVRAF